MLGALTFTLQKWWNVQPSTNNQQAKVEEDVDADIIYLLLGFLVQMIWGEVPGENWEGFRDEHSWCRNQDDQFFFRANEAVPKGSVWGHWQPATDVLFFSGMNIQLKYKWIEGGGVEKSPFEDPTSLSFFF